MASKTEKSGEEKVTVHVRGDYIDLKLTLDKQIIENYGGMEEVSRLVNYYIGQIMGDLSYPLCREDFARANEITSKLKKMVLIGERKGIIVYPSTKENALN